MHKRQVVINAIMSVAQVVVLGALLLVLYRYLLATIGVEQLGIWSLVLAATSVTRLTTLGLSGSVVRFVAKYVSRAEDYNVAGILETATLSVGALIGLALLVVYPFANWLLARIVPPNAVAPALSLLPYALVSLWLTTIASVFQAGLDGYQRMDLRSMLLMVGTGLQLVLVFLWVPRYGLMGLAYGQVVQGLALLAGSWVLLRRQLPILPMIPYRWRRDLFSEMVPYGANFQIVTVASLLYDPMTKALLTSFGNLSMVGYYEMASRMVLQLRSLMTSANQVLVPAVADLHEREPAAIRAIYRDSYSLLTYVAFPAYCGFIVCLPLVSEILVGRYERKLVLIATWLTIGWFFNMLSAPAYFVNLGTGYVRWNTVSHLAIGALNGGLGLLLGRAYGGWGVILAWVFSLSAGSYIISFTYHLQNQIPLYELFPRQSGRLALASGIAGACSLAVYYQLRGSLGVVIVGIVMVIGFMGIVALPLWAHPMRRRLLGWVAQTFPRTKEAT